VAQTSEEINPSDNANDDSSDEALHREAIERFSQCVQAESANRQLAKDDIEFVLGDQWPQDIKNERREDGRPCLVINRMAQVVNQITNDQRQNKPSIKVSPVDDKADIQTAKVRQGLIRHIEYDSNADIAYANAFEFAVMGGFGYLRVITEYCDPTSFKQEAKIVQIKNPFSAYLDPLSKLPDGSDAEFGFVFDDLSKKQYDLTYPKSKLAGQDGLLSIGDQAPVWLPGGSVRIAEYFYKKYVPDTLLLLSTGEEVLKSKVDEIGLPDGVTIEDQRETKIPKIAWIKLNGAEILEKTTFPGKYIPIIPCYGKDIYIDGKRILKGITRDAKDPARMYNFMASAEAEAIALAPKAPFIADPKQIEGFENIWKTANRKNNSYLPYNMIVGNQVVPPPQRASSDISTQAITNARMLASDDLKASTGVFDAALGNQSNETSGVAIQRRTAQSNTSNFHFIDNLNKSIRHTGRILNDIIPYVYDTEQTARILGDEGDERVVHLNRPFEENGKQVMYDMSVGKYDVTIDTGPSFQTKRQEAVSSMLEMARAAPQIMQAAPDIIAKNMDWPGAQEIAERLKKTLPPGLADDKNSKDIPPQIQAQMQQMSQMVEALTKQLNQLNQEKEQKLVELQSKERIEFKKLEVELEIERAKLSAKDSLAVLTAEIGRIQQHIDLLPQIPANENPQPSQNFESANGAMGAVPQTQPQPTGGPSPGQILGDNP